MSAQENRIAKTDNVLLVLGEPADERGELQEVIDTFCGVVTHTLEQAQEQDFERLYICGDLDLLAQIPERSRIIREFSTELSQRSDAESVEMITLGQVPLLVHGVGVFYRRYFDQEDLFEQIQHEHVFQNLTESTKNSKALRTGIYLTDVRQELDQEGGEILHYRLLRCSSNLTGPTDNFRATDRMIMGAVNEAAAEVFEQETSVNHVLAQIYENSRDDDERGRERKAKIGAHSDKTKDMREDGLIVFCTFYDPAGFGELERSESDPFDWCYNETSGLTKLQFKRKPTIKDTDLVEEFSVTLYPNSVLMIPLSTNRLYTHAIRPSVLNVERIPTRMGYVARCSKAEAQFMDGKTYLKEDGALVELEPMTRETLSDLRGSYRKENKTAEEIAYGRVHFSMNEGDYEEPIY